LLLNQINTLLNSISTSDKQNIDEFFSNVFINCYEKYMNNRIGTELKPFENIQINFSNKKFNKGDIIGYKILDKYHISCIKNIKNIENNQEFEIITCDIHGLLNNEKKISIFVIYNDEDIVKIHGNIQQDYRLNLKMSEEEILETYYC
jgi:hypothetical protein